MTMTMMMGCDGPGCTTSPRPEQEATDWLGLYFSTQNAQHFCSKECLLRRILLPADARAEH